MRVMSFLIMAGVLIVSTLGCGGGETSPQVNTASKKTSKEDTGGATLGSDGWEGTSRATDKAAPRAGSPDVISGGSPTGRVESPRTYIPGGGEKKAEEKRVAKEEAPVATPPVPAAAIADPVTGAERRVKKAQEPALPAGVLTAGSFDDNIDPRAFLSFLKKVNQLQGMQDVPAKLQGQRVLIQVKDAAGKPVGGAKVQLIAQTGQAAELITRTDGRVVFLTSFDNLPADVALTASVTPPDGGAAVTEKIDAGAPRWEVTLPAVQARLPKNLDLAIVLDTTGSMNDELDFLKGEIRGISKVIHERFPEVHQRFALIVYRDDNDEYVTRRFDFASLDAFHKNLSAQRAGGGGDYPEAVHRGFEDANQLRWRADDTARVLFWVADAPPHAQHMSRTMTAANALRKQGIAMYPVACSGYNDACELTMRSCALLTGSQFLFLTDDSGVGAAHGEPKIPYYQVEHLEKLMIRMIAGELAGQRIEANSADVIRTVGRKVN